MFCYISFSFVKGIYIQHIDAKAPNYLTEEYAGQTPYLKEDQLKEGNCCVRLRFSPFHPEEPGLRIFYAYKNLVKFPFFSQLNY